ncbi:MAG: extracellular solute-binding protein [Dehalococcoidia bacterium]|nr:extracellular solute-binding protein [Dehalococcoidia bacterium]
MMARKFYFIGLLMISLIIIASCAAPAVPATAPAPKQPAPVANPTSNLPAPTSQDTGWAKVVEAAKREGKLTVYTVHLFGDMGNEMSKIFFERMGIRVEMVSSGSSANLIERIKAERRAGSQVPSILTGAGSFVLVAKQDGLTEKMGDIPETRDESIYRYDPKMDKDGHMLSQQLLTMSPWVNTKRIPPGTEPKTWRDLLKPEWKGKIGITNPDTGPNAIYVYYGLISRGKLDQSYFTELAKQDLQFYANVGLASSALSQGEVPLAFSNVPAANSLGPFLLEGAPLKAIDMAEGIPIYRSGAVALLQGSPHPNAARVFINWLFSKEGVTIFSKYSGTVGFRKDVPSFIPPQGQLTPVNSIMMTLEDELEIAKIQRERTLTKMLRGS